MFRESYNGENRKIFWQEMWRHEFDAALEDDPVVIVPVGSVEQHGPHCPTDVDIVGPFYMACEAVKGRRTIRSSLLRLSGPDSPTTTKGLRERSV